jgi:hypothetical protein
VTRITAVTSFWAFDISAEIRRKTNRDSHAPAGASRFSLRRRGSGSSGAQCLPKATKHLDSETFRTHTITILAVMSASIDPIQYAWKRCNHGVPLPSSLARHAAASHLPYPLSITSDAVVPNAVVGTDTTQAALQSYLVRELPTGFASNAGDELSRSVSGP